ncbi:MAG TPA: hypothetical protein VK886_10050 [Vicinamibacterales bacterium]|nr:hypothetical protein [Vicinamibacterales bacterium]
MTLAYVDTAIALIVVLILTQITSELLAWRGTSLRWALIQLVKTIEPQAGAHTEALTLVSTWCRAPITRSISYRRSERSSPGTSSAS